MGTRVSKPGGARAVPAAGRARPSWEWIGPSGSTLKWDWALSWNVRVLAAGTALALAPPSLARASTHPRTWWLIARGEPSNRGTGRQAHGDQSATKRAGRPPQARKQSREPTAAPAVAKSERKNPEHSQEKQPSGANGGERWRYTPAGRSTAAAAAPRPTGRPPAPASVLRRFRVAPSLLGAFELSWDARLPLPLTFSRPLGEEDQGQLDLG